MDAETGVRDSKAPNDGELLFSVVAWSLCQAAIREGQLM
jgi:hypothetical protein